MFSRDERMDPTEIENVYNDPEEIKKERGAYSHDKLKKPWRTVVEWVSILGRM